MITKKIWKKIYKSNKHGAITGAALIAIAIIQIPGSLKKAAEVICIGQTSNKIYSEVKFSSIFFSLSLCTKGKFLYSSFSILLSLSILKIYVYYLYECIKWM